MNDVAPDDDALARQLRSRLDRELAGLHATDAARRRLLLDAVEGATGAGRRGVAGRPGRRRGHGRAWLAVPLAAAAAAGVVMSVVLAQGLVTSGRGPGPAGSTATPAATPAATLTPTPTATPASRVDESPYRLVAVPPRRGVTAGRPVRVLVIARLALYRSATIDWGDGSATTEVAGNCPGARGTASREGVRHTYRESGHPRLRAMVQPCESRTAPVEVTLVLPVGPAQ